MAFIKPEQAIDVAIADSYLSGMLAFAKPIAHAIEKVFNCNRCAISVIGLEVPHAHMHLIPVSTINDINFSNKKLQAGSKEELTEVQKKIVAAL